MTRHGQTQAAEGRRVLLWVWLVLVLIISGLAGFYWYLAPLAMGFSQASAPVPRTQAGLRLVDFAWHVGLPAFGLGQIAAFVWAFWNLRAAAVLATALLAGFLVLIVVAMRAF